MAFLKKHFVWIVLGLILLAEGGATFVLLGRKRAVKRDLEELDGMKKQVADLTREGYDNIDDRVKELKQVRKYLHDERSKLVLYFWRRDQAIERVFDDKGLKKFKIRPWDEAPSNIDSFRLAIQRVYNREAEKLVVAAEKLYISRGGLGLASDVAFTQPDITVGDIYGALKEFWVRAEIVQTALKTDMKELDPIGVTRRPDRVGVRARREEEPKGQLQRPIAVTFSVRCPYPRLGEFTAELSRSPLSFRVKSIEQIVAAQARAGAGPVRGGRAPLPVPGRPAGYPRRGMTPEMEMEGPPPEGMPPGELDRGPEPEGRVPRTPDADAVPPAEQLVQARLLCEVSDFQLGVASAKFTGSAFENKAAVRQWLEARIAALKPSAWRDLWGKLLKDLDSADGVKEEGGGVEIVPRKPEHFAQDQDPYTVALEDEKSGSVEIEFRVLIFEPRESQDGVAVTPMERR